MSTITNTKADESAPVRQIIRAASAASGVGFQYLVDTASRESNMNPSVRARSSSATGLFQFIDSTWLQTMKDSGADYGYGKQAAAISKTGRGGYTIEDPAMRREIMNLRYDPQANAMMAGAFTQKNQDYLRDTLGREPSDGELYIAHFMGAQGAGRLIGAAQARPDAPAANIFPQAASANKSIFFARNGQKRSLSQVYAQLVSKHQSSPLEAQQFASAIPAATRVQTAPAQNSGITLGPRGESGPIFHNLFTARRGAPVSPVVAALWARRAEANTATAEPIAVVATRSAFFPTSKSSLPVENAVITESAAMAPVEAITIEDKPAEAAANLSEPILQNTAIEQVPAEKAVEQVLDKPLDLLSFRQSKRRR